MFEKPYTRPSLKGQREAPHFGRPLGLPSAPIPASWKCIFLNLILIRRLQRDWRAIPHGHSPRTPNPSALGEVRILGFGRHAHSSGLVIKMKPKPAARQVEGDDFPSPHDTENFLPKVSGACSIGLAGFNG